MSHVDHRSQPLPDWVVEEPCSEARCLKTSMLNAYWGIEGLTHHHMKRVTTGEYRIDWVMTDFLLFDSDMDLVSRITHDPVVPHRHEVCYMPMFDADRRKDDPAEGMLDFLGTQRHDSDLGNFHTGYVMVTQWESAELTQQELDEEVEAAKASILREAQAQH